MTTKMWVKHKSWWVSFHFQYEEVDAEELQKLLNDKILKGLDCETPTGFTEYELNKYSDLIILCTTAMLLGLSQIKRYIFYFYSGDLKAGGFSIDACRSMVALMDVSSYAIFIVNWFTRKTYGFFFPFFPHL